MKNVLILILALKLLSFCTDSENQNSELRQLTLVSGETAIAVDLDLGGRISSLQHDGQEILNTKRDSNNIQWGSTVWTSPQKDWNWPPPAWIDTEAYTLLGHSNSHIEIESKKSPEEKLQCRKMIQVVGVDSFLLKYTLTNTGIWEIKAGIWENTRIPYVGNVSWEAERSSWELGSEGRPVPGLDGVNLLNHKKSRKIYSMSEGGYLNYENKGVLFKKTFEVLSPENMAPKHKTIEVYYDPERYFAELEVHGKYQSIAPGASIKLSVMWTCSKQL